MTLLRLLAILAASASPTLSQAGESAKPFHWSNGAAIATEYVWRGQSLTDGKPAIFGELKISHETGVYGGIWAGSL
ncbi:MAG: TorF family putative porin, partial [Pseudoxanthomonas sp.]